MADSYNPQRQSAPTPTAMDFVNANMDSSGAINGFMALEQPIGREAVQKAMQTLQKYKEGKTNLESKIIHNEQWYKMRHWEEIRGDKEEQVEPASGWLFNSIANKHADSMDNFPSPNILPREEGDKAEAEMLSSIVPVILEQNDFEQTYSDVCEYKLKTGTGVYGVFWDSNKLNGLGDICIEQVDLINLFWESGIKDIQDSRNIFYVTLMDNDLLAGEYPQLQGKLAGNPTIDVSKYIYDDTVDTTNKSAVIDWYYKRRVGGKTVLHYCKFVDDVVLFATENDPRYKERGLYDHGEYPFIFDVLYKIEGTPAGFGYIDIGKNPQEYIDRSGQAILMNLLANTKPRHFVRNDGSVNEKEYADMTKDFVHVEGNLGDDSIKPIQGKPLNEIYVNVMLNKIDELKETTGNRDVSTGGTASGVTAAAAIAAMQEAGSKLTRDNSKAAYRAYKKLIKMVVELIRQFYDMPRCFRILGENGAERFVQYSNAGIQPQYQGMISGVDMGYRTPLFDIEITAQKSSPYSKMAQNELALQFYNAGFFNPQLADQALVCLDMMDFERKQFVMSKIAQNGTMYQMMMQMQQQMLALGGMVDAARGDNSVTQSLMSQFGMGQPIPAGSATAHGSEALGGEASMESNKTKKARERTADMTNPT